MRLLRPQIVSPNKIRDLLEGRAQRPLDLGLVHELLDGDGLVLAQAEALHQEAVGVGCAVAELFVHILQKES